MLPVWSGDPPRGFCVALEDSPKIYSQTLKSRGAVWPRDRWRLKSIINIAGVRRARRRSTSAPPVWRGFLFAIIARRAAVGRTYRQQLIGAVFAMSLLALGRNGRSQAGAEASGLDSLIPPSSHIPFLVSRRGVECEFRNVCHVLRPRDCNMRI